MNLPIGANNMVLLQFDIRTSSKIGKMNLYTKVCHQMFKSIGSAQSSNPVTLRFLLKKVKNFGIMLATWPNSYTMERYLVLLSGRMRKQELICKIKHTEIQTTLF